MSLVIYLVKKRDEKSHKRQVLLLGLVLVLVCAAQETPAEIDPSKVPRMSTGEWRTIYAAADNKEKTMEGGPLRGYYRQVECINDCEYLSTTFYAKDDGRCQSFTKVIKRQEGDAYVSELSGTNVFQLIHVSDNMLVTYIENDDGEKITKITEGVGRGKSFTPEELQKYQELNSERGIPNENVENVIETGKAPEDKRLKEKNDVRMQAPLKQ
ncbi:allergen Bos d 2-like [Dama dama]|uniref:allergen Bos d 2-like n=1 Tax=Dama dama TaxID=30532 RepID=UPI002A3692FE|nr:allergen Bos d 2-like [Dama dama]